jgi:hypothetical protein
MNGRRIVIRSNFWLMFLCPDDLRHIENFLCFLITNFDYILWISKINGQAFTFEDIPRTVNLCRKPFGQRLT